MKIARLASRDLRLNNGSQGRGSGQEAFVSITGALECLQSWEVDRRYRAVLKHKSVLPHELYPLVLEQYLITSAAKGTSPR